MWHMRPFPRRLGRIFLFFTRKTPGRKLCGLVFLSERFAKGVRMPHSSPILSKTRLNKNDIGQCDPERITQLAFKAE